MLLNWVLEKTLENPLDSKEIKPVNPKWNQPWIFIGRTDAEAETPILWPPDAKSQLIGKDPDAGKDWGQEKGVTEDEIVGWLKGHEVEQILGDSKGQWSLAFMGFMAFMGLDTELQQQQGLFTQQSKLGNPALWGQTLADNNDNSKSNLQSRKRLSEKGLEFCQNTSPSEEDRQRNTGELREC